MRDKNRIKPFLQKLEDLWLQYPDLRFGQIIYMLSDKIGRDIFFPEEKEWEVNIDKLLCNKFGNLESDVGCCVDCSVERNDLFRRCWEYSKSENVKKGETYEHNYPKKFYSNSNKNKS